MKHKLFKMLTSSLLILSMVFLSYSSAFAAPTTPNDLTAPTSLFATAGDAQINLTWSAVEDASSYNVYQSLDGINFNLISLPLTVTITNYEVNDLTNGLIYYFKITAANAVGESAYSNVVSQMPSVGPAPINLGTAGNYAILAKTGISTVPNSVVTGDIAVSPIDSTAITGFSLTLDATTEFSTSKQLVGKAFASDYASPTPSKLTTAISNMQTAYVDAAGRAPDYTELYTGNISGKTLTAGVYKWGTGVLITSDVTLHGGPNDVFVFQIAKGITQASGTKITLTGGVQAKNIFWQAAQTVAIGTGSHFEGIVLGKTNISLGTNASINGRLLAQTAVTLIKSTVVAPSVDSAPHLYSISVIGNPTLQLGQSGAYGSDIYDNGKKVLDQSVEWSLSNQDNSIPTMARITASTGKNATVEVGSESSYVNKYVVLTATLKSDPRITTEKLIQIQ
ncbi:MAG: ice-binding family protein [Gorillibacterium sp.]|nr:ice-binding family protein [Gorillibacterium sp.]